MGQKSAQLQRSHCAFQGVVFIVFPEGGLMPPGVTKQRAYNFTEHVANPHSENPYNPCTAADVVGIEVQKRLSCMAMRHSMYVTANIGERESCDAGTDPNCPADGRYQFNTNVVFDPDGFLIARYRKYNLFLGEPAYNKPNYVDYTYFDTPFGRFGAIVCFDIIFDQPAVELVEKYNVTHVLFPTAWMNQLPYYSAVTFHQAFAVGMRVNLFAANRRNPAYLFCGSGIYGSNETYAYVYNETSMTSSLLIAEVPAAPVRIPSRIAENHAYDLSDHFDFEGQLFADLFRFVRLTDAFGSTSVCHNSLCCRLNYSREMTEDVFALGAFKGLHTFEGQYYLEMCVLVKCRIDGQSQCLGDSKTSATRFTYFSLTGNFTTKYIYPMVVSDGIDPSSGDWEYIDEHVVSNGMKKPLLSSTMYGRRFDLDNAETTEISVQTSTTKSDSTGRNVGCSMDVNRCLLTALFQMVYLLQRLMRLFEA
jgi:pantetheine hydrolase